MIRTLPALAALVLLDPAAGRIEFAPAKDLELAKRFTFTLAQELDELSIVAGGTDVTEMLGDLDFSLDVESVVAVEDVYLEPGDGRPAKLKRAFDEIGVEVSVEYSSEFDSGTHSESAESDLEGETVVFTWSEEDGDFAVAFEGGEGDTRLLEGLTEDMDLRALLPSAEVEEGEQWQVEPRTLLPILAPGGSLGMGEDEDDDELAELFAALEDVDVDALVASLFSGEIVCTYKGTRDGDAGKLAVIDVEIEIDSATDLSALILELADAVGEELPEGFSLPTADLELSIEGTALLEWNLERGHFQHFEANLETGVALRVVAEAEGESADATIGLSGSVALAADVVAR